MFWFIIFVVLLIFLVFIIYLFEFFMEKIYKLGVKKKVFVDLKGWDKVWVIKNECVGYFSVEFFDYFCENILWLLDKVEYFY